VLFGHSPSQQLSAMCLGTTKRSADATSFMRRRLRPEHARENIRRPRGNREDDEPSRGANRSLRQQRTSRLERIGPHPSYVLCKIVVRQIVITDAVELPCRLYAKMKLIRSQLK
jgi:hypothetical protein